MILIGCTYLQMLLFLLSGTQLILVVVALSTK